MTPCTPIRYETIEINRAPCWRCLDCGYEGYGSPQPTDNHCPGCHTKIYQAANEKRILPGLVRDHRGLWRLEWKRGGWLLSPIYEDIQYLDPNTKPNVPQALVEITSTLYLYEGQLSRAACNALWSSLKALAPDIYDMEGPPKDKCYEAMRRNGEDPEG